MPPCSDREIDPSSPAQEAADTARNRCDQPIAATHSQKYREQVGSRCALALVAEGDEQEGGADQQNGSSKESPDQPHAESPPITSVRIVSSHLLKLKLEEPLVRGVIGCHHLGKDLGPAIMALDSLPFELEHLRPEFYLGTGRRFSPGQLASLRLRGVFLSNVRHAYSPANRRRFRVLGDGFIICSTSNSAGTL